MSDHSNFHTEKITWDEPQVLEDLPVDEPQSDHGVLIDVDNPLVDLSPSDLEADVKAFADYYGLGDVVDLLHRGARVAQDPEAFNTIPGLTDEEKLALKREKKLGFWRQTKDLKVTIVTCAVAAIIQGWHQSSMNGANLFWAREFGLHVGASTGDGTSNTTDIWIFAFVNAAPFIFAALIGAWISDPLNEYVYGRRAAIFTSAIFCFVSVIGSACTKNWQQLLACRILLAIGMGSKASVVPVFAAEVSPSHLRGSLVMNWQLFDAVGIFLGFSANLALFDIGELNWRLQLAVACLPAVPLLFLIWTCPESPRFLINRKAYRQAYLSLLHFNETPLQAARELYYIHAQVKAEKRLFSKGNKNIKDAERSSYHSESSVIDHTPHGKQGTRPRFGDLPRKVWQLVSVARIRRAALAAFVVMISQQLCGVNIIAFYSSSIFIPANMDGFTQAMIVASQKKAMWVSWGFGLTNALFALPATYTIDRRGRRALLLFTIPFLAIMLLGAAFAFKISPESDAHIGVITLFVILFAIFYSPGLGPVPFTYSAEVFPLVNRVVGMSYAVFWNLLGAGILSLVVPLLNDSLKATGLCCLFAGLNVVAFVLVYLFVYETKEASLEELNSIFSVKTVRHISYQFRQVLPWPWRYYVTKSVSTKLDPPYRWKHGRL